MHIPSLSICVAVVAACGGGAGPEHPSSTLADNTAAPETENAVAAHGQTRDVLGLAYFQKNPQCETCLRTTCESEASACSSNDHCHDYFSCISRGGPTPCKSITDPAILYCATTRAESCDTKGVENCYAGIVLTEILACAIECAQACDKRCPMSCYTESATFQIAKKFDMCQFKCSDECR